MTLKPEPAASSKDPILVDLGRKSRKSIKRLRDGEGKLLAEIQGTVDELKANGTIADSAQPLIILVREKRTARTMNPLWPIGS